MKVDEVTVEKIAALARLDLNDAEKQDMITDMNRILDFMSKLNEVDTAGIEPLIYLTDTVDNTRPDEVKQVITHTEALLNAPKHDGEYFLVPKVIDIK